MTSAATTTPDAAAAAPAPLLPAGTWNVDPAHTTVSFVARHLMVSKVRGTFGGVTGTLTVDGDPLRTRVEATVDAATVSTGDEGRDTHLRSADFFDVDNHPTWTLVGTAIRLNGDNYVLTAELTIRGITRTVEFDVTFEGVATDPWGGTRAAFTATADVNRKEWGLEWNVALETGGVLVGEKVRIELEIQAVQS
jgi:polyisoprenoid-binding protein YceI